MRVLRAPAATDTFCPARRGCGPRSEPGETQKGPSGLRGPGDGQRLSPVLAPAGKGNPAPLPARPPPPSVLCASLSRCVTPVAPWPSLGSAGDRPEGNRSSGWGLLPGGAQPRFPRKGARPPLNPGWGSSLPCCALGPGFGPGIPLGLGKGSSDWLMPHVTSGPPRCPLPQRHVGAAAAGEGPGVQADSGCPPALSRQLGGADAILLGQIFPSSQIPLQPPQNGSCSGGRCAG